MWQNEGNRRRRIGYVTNPNPWHDRKKRRDEERRNREGERKREREGE